MNTVSQQSNEVYRSNEPGVQSVHAVLCTSKHRNTSQIYELSCDIIDFLLKKGWTPPAQPTKD